jgi:hypothetical protein
LAKQLLRESVWTSQKLARCSLETHLAFPFLLPIANHWGLFELDYRAIWQKVAAYRDDLDPGRVTLWLKELEDRGLFKRYQGEDGKLYGAWLNFKGLPVSQRTATDIPEPPFDNSLTMEQIQPDWRAPTGRVGTPYPLPTLGVPIDRELVDKQETSTKTLSAPTTRRKVKAVSEQIDTEQNRALIDAYNAAFGTAIGFTPGNLRAAVRTFASGYSIEHCKTVFAAVKAKATVTALWCHDNNREFEYLIRPAYKHNRSQETVQGPLDKIPNELATGRKQAS